MVERPTAEQRAAANPGSSAWVGANAGSGKTRVLTQRVARLLLAGSEPAKILCLTYTKAAAAEMQTRLFEMLGGWSMHSDGALGEILGALEGGASLTDPVRLAQARRLFARALETPGGLKIQTIHAFCAALLRRFPLEAGISPAFDVLEDRQQRLMLGEIVSDMALAAERGEDTAFDAIARRLNEGQLEEFLPTILGQRDRFLAPALDQRLVDWFGDAALGDLAELAARHLATLDWADMLRHADLLDAEGGKEDKALAGALQIAARDADPAKAVRLMLRALLTQKGTRRARRGFPVKAVLKVDPAADARTEALLDWAEAAADAVAAQEMAARSSDLHRFARALLTRYAAAKTRRGLLDYDDLIALSRDLLTRGDMGAWVLYKLDQGIDHILVDEAQDTAPQQWAVIQALSADFFAGEGARGGPEAGRSVFVVGDEKQSIYSFQGAEPRAFGATRARYLSQLAGVGGRLEQPALVTSFRSAPGVLGFVDQVFTGAERALAVDGGAVRHEAHRAEDAALIDLWPLFEPAEKPEPTPWYDPVDTPAPDHPKARLARTLAAEIARMVAQATLPPRHGAPSRPVRPGDILVLVQKRDRLARDLIRALKAERVPVAGADRLSLAAELAVKDLMALIKAVLMPADDLSLAAALRSPLFDISEDSLLALAHGRSGTLWQAVMQAEAELVGNAPEILADLAAKAGFQGPYGFLETILTRHDGRRRLLARLGIEAEDPVDELLTQAMAYEARETPSLPGFVTWIEAADIALKREMERADQVRVMTIHGAKGLEAPVVILPDTVSGSGGSRQKLLMAEGESRASLPLWPAGKPADDRVTAAARAEADAREAAEAQRKLYVALTRAEDWLILAGAGSPTDAEKGWYGQLAGAVAALAPSEVPGPDGLDGPIHRLGTPGPPRWAAADAQLTAHDPPPAPDWLTPAAPEVRPIRPTPSSIAGHAASGEAAGGEGLGREQALARGTAVHLLLEHLPEVAAAERPASAALLIAGEAPGLPPDLAAAAIDEVLSVLAHPGLRDLFGSGSLGEVAITLPIRQNGVQTRPILGRIDRLLVGETVTVVDFKTDPQVPGSAGEVSGAYLAQLALYALGAGAIWPDRPIEAAILWTRTATLMPVAPDRLQAALAPALERQGIDLVLNGS
ncbi:MAG: double-strand break repair helicase AddA [Pseudomonadota bacterium]